MGARPGTVLVGATISVGVVIRILLLLCTFSSLCFLPVTTTAMNAITSKHPLANGTTLQSPKGTFVLGFFTPDQEGRRLASRAGSGRYLGIWFGKTNETVVVWAANPDNPVPYNSTGILEISPHGDLCVSDRRDRSRLWCSGRSNGTADNRVAQLSDSGNLILTGDDVVVWQSFDYPFDTLIGGMKLGWDLRSGLNRYLRTWSGDANYSFDTHGVPQPFIRTNSSIVVRLGFWDGVHFTNRPMPAPDPIFRYEYEANKDEVYYRFVTRNLSNVGLAKLDSSGKLTRYLWDGEGLKWQEYWKYPVDQCDQYSRCGAFGVCRADVTACTCLQGFDNKLANGPNIRDGSDRCLRRTPLDCTGKRDGFQVVSGLKLPDTRNAIAWPETGLDECSLKCLTNCSCTAYSQLNVANDTGCILWFNDLHDIKRFQLDGLDLHGGLDLHLRLAMSDIYTDSIPKVPTKKQKLIVVLVILAVFGGVLFVAIRHYYKDLMHRRKQKIHDIADLTSMEYANECKLPSLSFMTITRATADFHPENKLGQGAFGTVYQGKLPNGEQIAVKRWSKSSRHGPREFSNEISLIAKVQHKNLVRLLAFCVHGEERMLIYEFMSNKSLSSFIFDDEKSRSLDWKMREEIIMGIGRGVDYLHHGSRLRIVHRDLKLGNILLDRKMNPKISDFGTATILEQDVTKASTKYVAGTYGYMSPEYVMNGIYSMKSDVYSFGIIVLEILTGIKNKVLSHQETTLTLPGYAWQLWKEGDIIKLLDKRIGQSSPTYILRYMHVALLCVQEEAEDRPEMSAVMVMLGTNSIELPQPKKPGYFTTTISSPQVPSTCRRQASSTAQITHTNLHGR